MKKFLTMIALVLATPAMAQTAPANPHADHAQQTAPAAACSPQHAAMGHCTLKADAAPAANPHAGHDMKGDCCEKGADGKMACCEKAKAAGEKLDCCEKKAGAADPHAGHNGQ